jgi:ABC-type uncharacterized transport system permease subunit
VNINLIAGVLMMILIYSVCVGVITERTVAFFECEYPSIVYRACRSIMTSALYGAQSIFFGLVRLCADGGLLF